MAIVEGSEKEQDEPQTSTGFEPRIPGSFLSFPSREEESE